MNTLDLIKIGATGYKVVEYLPAMREDVHLATNSLSEALDKARSILRKRGKYCLKPSGYLAMMLSSNA